MSEPLITIQPRRRRRRRVSPALLVLLVATTGFGIGWLWHWVFAPLFVDAQAHIAKERQFRKVLRHVVMGRPNDMPNAPELPDWPDPLTDAQVRILACAESQMAYNVRYTSRYFKLDYPWGDLPRHLSTAQDLIIRCMRATGLDLQQLIHLDRTAQPDRYPLRIWANKKADRSMDHRRLPNLYTFLKTYAGPTLPVLMDSPTKLAKFQPGDIVFWVAEGGGEFPGKAGIVSDRRGTDGAPRVITILPIERRISDHHRLDKWTVTTHLRVDPDAVLDRFLQQNPDARLAPRVGLGK